MNPIEQNKSNEALIEVYKGIYPKGGFGYDKEKERKVLWSIIDHSGGTLLDVGCGDGFWADILRERFAVTGIDISPEGIEIARKRFPNIEFILEDVLTWHTTRKFSTVFMRSPSFLNFETEGMRFKQGLTMALSFCEKYLWYIKWSNPPYDRYLEGSYIHDPEKVKKVLSQFGKVEIHQVPNYFFAKLTI